MPICSISKSTIQHRCSACGSTRLLGRDQLELGQLDELDERASVVVLPACASCGSVDYVVRSSDEDPSDLVGYDQFDGGGAGRPRARRRTEEDLVERAADGMLMRSGPRPRPQAKPS